MSRSVLIGLSIAWPVSVAATAAISRVRRRFLLLTAIGWLAAMWIATTSRPPDNALAIGLTGGVAASLLMWLATRRGVTLTWAQDKTYWAHNGPLPSGEKFAAALVVLIGAVALVTGLLT